MSQAPLITPIFVAIFTIAHMAITMRVGLYRGAKNIRYGDGGDEVLLRRMRGQGNFAENVPMALLAMGAAEISGASPIVILIGGLSLIIGRAMHYSVTIGSGWGRRRMLGMILTFVPFVLFSISILIAQF